MTEVLAIDYLQPDLIWTGFATLNDASPSLAVPEKSAVLGIVFWTPTLIVAVGGLGTFPELFINDVGTGVTFEIPELVPALSGLLIQPFDGANLNCNAGDKIHLVSDGLQIAATNARIGFIVRST